MNTLTHVGYMSSMIKKKENKKKRKRQNKKEQSKNKNRGRRIITFAMKAYTIETCGDHRPNHGKPPEIVCPWHPLWCRPCHQPKVLLHEI